MYRISSINYFCSSSSDISGKANMHQTIGTVKKSIADTQEEKRHVAYVHCHADQIKLGNTQLLFVCNSRVETFI